MVFHHVHFASKPPRLDTRGGWPFEKVKDCESCNGAHSNDDAIRKWSVAPYI
jgi:hypothetical protein